MGIIRLLARALFPSESGHDPNVCAMCGRKKSSRVDFVRLADERSVCEYCWLEIMEEMEEDE